MLTGVNSQIINVSKHYPFEGITSSLLVIVAVSTNLWLIPIYGIVGAAAATAISLVLFNVSRYFFIYSKMGLQPFDIKTVKAIFVIGLGFGIGHLLPHLENIYADIFYRSTIILGVISGLIIQLRISQDISKLFSKYIKR
jgi:O-antigen/teichoic acid export membrane protein